MGYDSSFFLAAQIFDSASLQTDLLIAQDSEQGLAEFRCVDTRCCGSAPVDANSEPFYSCRAVIGVEPLRKDNLGNADSVKAG